MAHTLMSWRSIGALALMVAAAPQVHGQQGVPRGQGPRPAVSRGLVPFRLLRDTDFCAVTERRCVRVQIYPDTPPQPNVLPKFSYEGRIVPVAPNSEALLGLCRPPDSWRPEIGPPPAESCAPVGQAWSRKIYPWLLEDPPVPEVLHKVCATRAQTSRLPLALIWMTGQAFDTRAIVAWSYRLEFNPCP